MNDELKAHYATCATWAWVALIAALLGGYIAYTSVQRCEIENHRVFQNVERAK